MYHHAFARRDPALRVIYLDLVYQRRQIAEDYEAIDKERSRRTVSDQRAQAVPN